MRTRVTVAALALVAGIASFTTSRLLFPLYTLNRDDTQYVLLARLLRAGHLTLPASQARFFRPWASGLADDHLALKYAPPWPSVLLAGDVLGSMRWGPALVAAAVVVAMAALARRVTGDRVSAVVAAAIVVLSPVFVIQSGTYLPYLFELLLLLVFALLLLRGGGRATVAAGAVFAVAFWARPYDAVLFALPFAVLVLLDVRDDRAKVVATVRRLAAGAVPIAVLELAANWATTGSPLKLPYSVTGGSDTFGFGDRGVFPGLTVPFSFWDGLRGIGSALWWLPSWTFGGVVLVAVAVVGFRGTLRRREAWAVLGVGVMAFLGYLFFWGSYAMTHKWRGVQTLGPFYQLPALVPLAVFGAHGLTQLARRATRARATVAALVAIMVALTAYAVPDKIEANDRVTDDYRAAKRAVAGLGLRRGIVFLPLRGDLGFLDRAPFLQNDPGLRNPVLYAQDRESENFALLDRLRRGDAGQMTLVARPGSEPEPRAVHLRRTSGGALSFRLQVIGAGGRSATAFFAVGDGLGQRQDVGPATRSAIFTLGPARSGRGTVRVGVVIDGERWELRVPYRFLADGTVEVLLPGKGSRSRPPGGPQPGVTADVSSMLVLEVG